MARVELEARAGDLRRHQRIDHDQPVIALDHRHVRDVEATDLIDPVGHLEESVVQVEPRQAPQARIDGGRCVLVAEEGVVAQRPHDAALLVLDFDLGQRRDEAVPRVVEVLLVGERQRVEHGPIQGGRDR
jgi:hypothetical protein